MSRENPRELIKRARASIEMGRPEVGLPLAVQAAGTAPNDTWVLSNLAWLQFVTKRYDDALRTCGRAIAADPEYEWPHRLRGASLWEVGRLEAATSALAEAVRLAPNEPLCLLKFAQFAAVVGRPNEAIRAANRVTELAPENPGAWFALGWASWSAGEWETAESALIHSRDLNPSSSNYHNNLGALYIKLGRFEEAAVTCRSAIEIDPRARYAYKNLANSLRGLDRWDEAAELENRHYINAVHDADERVERVGDCSSFIGQASANLALLRLSAVDEALRRAEELTETTRDRSSVKEEQLAAALARVRMEDAVQRARELIRDHGDESLALRNAAAVGWMTDEPSLARDAARLAEQQSVVGRHTWVCRACVALAEARWADAAREYEGYLSTSFLVCCAHAEGAYATYKNGDLEAARSYLRKTANRNPNCETLRVLDHRDLMPVKELLPAEIRPFLLSQKPLA